MTIKFPIAHNGEYFHDATGQILSRAQIVQLLNTTEEFRERSSDQATRAIDTAQRFAKIADQRGKQRLLLIQALKAIAANPTNPNLIVTVCGDTAAALNETLKGE